MTGEIIKFPKRKRRTLPQTEEEARTAIAEYRIKLINDMVNTRFSQTIRDFSEFGFPVDSKEFIKNVVISNEILKAVLYRSANIYHPMYEDVQEFRKKYDSGLTALSDIDKIFEDENEE